MGHKGNPWEDDYDYIRPQMGQFVFGSKSRYVLMNDATTVLGQALSVVCQVWCLWHWSQVFKNNEGGV